MSTLKTNNIQHVDRSDPSIIINTDGGVSIAGTLTYEDVTSVDAVGIVTAREILNAQKQVHVGTGVSVKAGGINVTAGITTVQDLQAQGDVSIVDTIYHSGDTNTKIRFPAGDTFTVETGGNERIRVDGSGNLLVGATSASGKFHVEHSGEVLAYIIGNTSSAGSRLVLQNKNTTANSYAGVLGADAGGQTTAQVLFYSADNDNNEGFLTLETRPSGGIPTERLRITSAGNVGINETSPSHKLVVGGDIGVGFNTPNDAARQIVFNANRGSAGDTLANINWQWNSKNVAQIRGIAGADTSNKDDGHLAFFTSAANNLVERLRIDSAGKVGINREATQHPLEVQHSSEPTISFWRGSTKGAAVQAQSGGTYLYSYQGAPLLFSTNSGNGFSERFRIDSSGRLLFGVTSSTRETSLILQGNSNSYTTNPGVLELRVGQVPSSASSLGSLVFGCTGDKIGATISAIADNSDWSSGSSHPTAIRFFTTPASSTTQVERARITRDGHLKKTGTAMFSARGQGASWHTFNSGDGWYAFGDAATGATNYYLDHGWTTSGTGCGVRGLLSNGNSVWENDKARFTAPEDGFYNFEISLYIRAFNGPHTFHLHGMIGSTLLPYYTSNIGNIRDNSNSLTTNTIEYPNVHRNMNLYLSAGETFQWISYTQGTSDFQTYKAYAHTSGYFIG